MTMFKPKLEEYRRMYKRKGFHDAVLEAEHNPGIDPPAPPEEVSSEEEDLNENSSAPKKRRSWLNSSSLALSRSLFTNREYFFGANFIIYLDLK
jgi:hypothetical protein